MKPTTTNLTKLVDLNHQPNPSIKAFFSFENLISCVWYYGSFSGCDLKKVV
jgi:hypothetical protein